MKKLILPLLAISLALAAPATAPAATGDPVGYDYCGVWDSEYETFDPYIEADGAWQELWARNMSCSAAERNQQRMTWTRSGKIWAPGYTCRQIHAGWEYSDIRCTKRNRPNTSFRYRTGA